MNNFTKSIVYSGVVLAAGLVAIFAIYNNMNTAESNLSYIEPAAGEASTTEATPAEESTIGQEAIDAASQAAEQASEAATSAADAVEETASEAVESAEEAVDATAEAIDAEAQDATEPAAGEEVSGETAQEEPVQQ